MDHGDSVYSLFDGEWHDLWYARDDNDFGEYNVADAGKGGTRDLSDVKMSTEIYEECYFVPAGNNELWVFDAEDDEPWIDLLLGPGFHGLKKGEQRRVRVRITREVEWLPKEECNDG